MPVLTGRRRAVAIALLAMTLIPVVAVPTASASTSPPGLTRFMAAVAKVESGGRYTARNPVSGAYGKYQIMPSSWRAWARQYLGNADAPATAANQEKVAKAKMTSLYRWLGKWQRVAYWWLTGSDRTSGWSSSSRTYVTKVMTHYYGSAGTPGGGSTAGKLKHVSEASRTIDYGGRWRSAGHRGYVGGHVKYSVQAGATATVTFTGTRIQWYGPVGPTRGQARVSIDGAVVRVVNLQRAGFTAHALVFSKAWTTAGKHTLTIEVIGTKGHPLVAIDEFVVRR